MMTSFEIYAIGAQSNGLMFVKDFDAAGTKTADSISDLLKIVRTCKSAYTYDDNCEWKRRAIHKFIATEYSTNGIRLGVYTFDRHGNEIR